MFPPDIKKLPHQKFKDDRGNLDIIFENEAITNALALKRSFSIKNVFRGLHYQTQNCPQTKYIEVVSGKILDIVLCMDCNSENFGKVFSEKITPGTTYVIPSTYAHGFFCYEDTVFQYLTLGPYSEKDELVIALDRNHFIDLDLTYESIEMSPKDKNGMSIRDALSI